MAGISEYKGIIFQHGYGQEEMEIPAPFWNSWVELGIMGVYRYIFKVVFAGYLVSLCKRGFKVFWWGKLIPCLPAPYQADNGHCRGIPSPEL